MRTAGLAAAEVETLDGQDASQIWTMSAHRGHGSSGDPGPVNGEDIWL